ncbi:MAG TPA: tripartite tricarboxylate transporter substrate-binding protein, partial [Burkholderiaceae bacterium]|nr:tripartite tricarboxylate transporter substrate-binding protein [Burkholderiaceae bacterium]
MPARMRRALLLATLCAVAHGAAAQEAWPDRPVRFVTWSSPGGNIDVAMRTVGERLALKWKQPVIAENRVGASGIIATEHVAKSKPDGYTVLVTTPTAQI